MILEYLALAACSFVDPGDSAPAPFGSDLLPGFVENHGQWEAGVRFAGLAGGRVMAVCEDRLLFVGSAQGSDAERDGVGTVVVALVFESGSRPLDVRGVDPLGKRHSFFLGNDPSRWASDLPGFREVRIRDAAPGVDVVVSREGESFRYDLEVGAYADSSSVRVRIDGAHASWIAEDGCLCIDTGYGVLRQSAPRSWVEAEDGARLETSSRFVKLDEDRYGFDARGIGNGAAGRIDPGLEWATLVGLKAECHDLEVDTDGTVIATGATTSPLFPTTPGVYDAQFGATTDCFVARLSSSGSALLASTFYGGGTGSDWAAAVTVGADGRIAVTGRSTSASFPITPTAVNIFSPNTVFAIVGRFGPDLSTLEYSGRIGGAVTSSFTEGTDLLIVGDGSIVVVGSTSAALPISPGVIDMELGPALVREGWAVKLGAPSWSSIDWLTYLGGSKIDVVVGVEEAQDGSIVLAVTTRSSDFPMHASALDGVLGDGIATDVEDAAIVVLESDATAIRASTYLGGAQADYAYDLAIGPTGDVVVVGRTQSVGFPTTPGVAFPECNWGFSSGCIDGFVTKLPPDLNALSFSTFIGSAESEELGGVVLDSANRPTVVGTSGSQFVFPTTPGAFQEDVITSNHHIFVSRFSADAQRLIYSTSYSGTNSDGVAASGVTIDVDATGSTTISGITLSPNIPVTPGAYDTTWTSGNFVVARFDMLPKGVSRLGYSTPGCDGILAMEVTSMPYPGNPSFGVTCLAAPPQTTGFLVIGPAASPNPVSILGASLFVAPQGIAVLPVVSNSLGYAEVAAPLRAGSTPIGATVVGQFFWPDSCALGGISASQALVMTVQTL